MLAGNDLAQYIAHHYGRCRLEHCRCLDMWLGCACPNWEPVSAANWDELRELCRQTRGV